MTSIGQPLTRLDGRLKVTGGAQYTADLPQADALHGSIVHSTIASGRTTSIATEAAEEAPGVVAVLTLTNMPRMKPVPRPWSHLRPFGQGYLPLQDEQIHYAGQPVALVVADTLDQAAYAGTLIEVEYEQKPGLVFNAETARRAFDPPQFLWPVSTNVGDPARALAESPVRIERVYTTPDRHHNQMEPHATMASWDASGALTIYEATQHVFGMREFVSIVLELPQEKVTVISRFVGGGFGGKAYVWPHTLLAALAARVVRRPVRVQLTRAQMYSMSGRQPATIQTIALAAEKDGKLTGIRHDSISPTSMFDNYIEYAANASRSLWGASGGISTGHKILHVNHTTPTAMRSPHEALGHFATESAMDELAYAVGVDPVALRLLNDPAVDPDSGRPFSTRGMRRCLSAGAQRFGWDKRNPTPRSMRDGRYLIGQGVAGAIYTHWRWPAKARVVLKSDGSALVESGMHEIGGGTYTVMRQVAADALGLPPDRVDVHLGDTRLPYSHAAIGSSTMANAGASVLLAANAARDEAIALALTGRNPPFAGASAQDVVAADGGLTVGNRTITYTDLLVRNGLDMLSGDGDYQPVEEAQGSKAIFSFSALFAEVRVDEELGLVRLGRFVGAYDAGKIINPRTARSQAIGGIIWGVGQALLEQSETDPVMARFLHRNYSGYLVPTNADIPDLDVIFAGEFDSEASLLGCKGLGELTAVAVAPAIVNAVYHATGKRIRDLPVTVEKLLTLLPAQKV
jgi:xanthine dehydrogenase YagR molybdenum-binding subunit